MLLSHFNSAEIVYIDMKLTDQVFVQYSRLLVVIYSNWLTLFFKTSYVLVLLPTDIQD